MTNKAVCYTTDSGYIFPSFVSAIQARRSLSPELGDVLITAFGIDAQAEDAFGPACEREGIGLLSFSAAATEGGSSYYDRLFLDSLLPSHIDTLLYIDGDTQITRPLDPLLSYALPEGRFLAVADPMTFSLPGTDKDSLSFAAHFRALGLSPGQINNYFNSGVILSSRAVWRKLAQDALALSRAQPHDSRFPDQDMLNLAAEGRNLPLALAWNFPIYMMNARVADTVQPRIVHYMSNPKPWSGAFPPWSVAEFDIYGAAIRTYPKLAPYRTPMSLARRLRYQLQQRYKRMSESVSWGTGERRERILTYESAAILRSESPK